MFKKITFVAGLAIGFVAGSAAGREPFDQLKAQVTGVANDPEVRRKAAQAADKAKTTVQEQAPVVADKASDAVSKAKHSAVGAKDRVSEKAGSKTGGSDAENPSEGLEREHSTEDGSLAASSDSPETKHV